MLSVAIAAMLILDAIWLSLMKERYDALVRGVQGSKISVRTLPALFAYALMVIALAFLIVPAARNDPNPNKLFKALRYGGLFGFAAYGIFNATNLAIFEKYDYRMALVDTIWGTVLFTLVSWIAIAI